MISAYWCLTPSSRGTTTITNHVIVNIAAPITDVRVHVEHNGRRWKNRSYFIGSTHGVSKSFKFHSRQQDDETIETCVTILRKIAKSSRRSLPQLVQDLRCQDKQRPW